MEEIVLFSGGCDSTLVLYERAMTRLKDQNTYGQLFALSISHDQVWSQPQQKLAREKVKAEFIARQLPVEWIDVNISHVGARAVQSGDLTQPGIWLSTAALYLNSNSSLYCGYHQGDDYWVCRTSAEKSFNGMLEIMGKTNVKIEYPLATKSKAEILLELKSRKLYDLCWWCETGVEEATVPCGKCFPCQTHRTALWQIDTFSDTFFTSSVDSIADEKVEKEPAIQTCIGGS